MLARSRSRVQYIVALIWLLLTVSLASWWLALGLSVSSPQLRRMFVWEGVAFISLLLAGGVAIVMAVRREHLRRQALDTFFLSFTHDLKTSLASVQLQAEGLREDWPDAPTRPAVDRLIHDTVRLQIQLENSLFVAQPDGRLLSERIDAGAAIMRLAQDWPDLNVHVHGAAQVLADARAFDAVVRNVLQNAVVHGGAHRVDVALAAPAGQPARITIADDGAGVGNESFPSLGQPFARGTGTSGTGIGLFVCTRLMARMQGALRFDRGPDGRGLSVVMELPGAR